MFGLELYAQKSNNDVFTQLDKEIDSSKVYLQRKENELQRLKGNLSLANTPTDKYFTSEQIAEAYSHFDSDSAIYYYLRCRNIGEQANRLDWKTEATIGQAQVFADRGDNFLSMDHLSRLGSIEGIPMELRQKYVIALMSNYVRSTSNLSKDINISNSLQQWRKYSKYIPKGTITYITFEMMSYKNYSTSAIIKQLNEVLKHTSKPSIESAQCHLQLHIAYEKAGKYHEAVHEAVLASIDNIKMCNRSSPALVRLIEMMRYKNNGNDDLQRIINYLEVCMNDINGFHDVGRSLHVVAVQNGILQQYEEMTAKRHNVTMTVILLLAVVITVLLWLYRRQKHFRHQLENENVKLKESVEELENKVSEQNENKQRGERQLAEEAQRSSQLGSIMARQYRLLGMALTDVRKHKKEIANLITSGQNQKAVKLAKGSVLRDQTIGEYYQAFDEDFLSVYPDFVASINSEMKPDCQLKPEKEGALSPELRICALISLGVNDPKNIAEILQYSVQTVYNYTMKIRKGKITDTSANMEETSE